MEATDPRLKKIVSKLEFFNYRYSLDQFRQAPAETILKIYLPLFCFLRVSFSEGKVRMSSRIQYGFNFLSLEYNFLIYAMGLIALATYLWNAIPAVLFIGLGLILLHFLVCFIKLEFLKTIIHRWVEDEYLNQPSK